RRSATSGASTPLPSAPSAPRSSCRASRASRRSRMGARDRSTCALTAPTISLPKASPSNAIIQPLVDCSHGASGLSVHVVVRGRLRHLLRGGLIAGLLDQKGVPRRDGFERMVLLLE